MVGLDTEWGAGERVALVQLMVGDACLLVHVHALLQSHARAQRDGDGVPAWDTTVAVSRAHAPHGA